MRQIADIARVMAGLLVLAAGARADTLGCGILIDTVCPGCTDHSVTTGCYCGPDSGQCNCRKTSGGIQTDIWVSCESDFFDWNPDQPQFNISTGGQVPCSVTQKCMTDSGTQTFCTLYVLGLCPQDPPPNAPCQWRQFGTTTRTVLITNGNCGP